MLLLLVPFFIFFFLLVASKYDKANVLLFLTYSLFFLYIICSFLLVISFIELPSILNFIPRIIEGLITGKINHINYDSLGWLGLFLFMILPLLIIIFSKVVKVKYGKKSNVKYYKYGWVKVISLTSLIVGLFTSYIFLVSQLFS